MSQHWQERQQCEQRALASLVRAAGEMLTPTAEGKAAAMLYAAHAIIHLAASDPGKQAYELAMGAIAELQRQVTAREPP